MKAFLDTGFLLTVLTSRAGAERAWNELRESDLPVGISSLQLLVIRHGLIKGFINPKATAELRDVCANALRQLNWLLDQDVVRPADIDYDAAIELAEKWAIGLREPMASLLLVWPAIAVAGGAKTWLSFDPRTRALAEKARLKIVPAEL